MDLWRRRHPRKASARGGARRARVTALAVLIVMVAVAVLLTVLFHLGVVATVVVPVAIAVPGLYLAWPGINSPPGHSPAEKPAYSPPWPSIARKPTYSRPVRRWYPMELGVHRAIAGLSVGDRALPLSRLRERFDELISWNVGRPMPTYIHRPLDELLRAVLDPTVAASRLVVVRGPSYTGKTRAAYEAVTDRLPDWQLVYPPDLGALAAQLDARIPAPTVLWLDDLPQYADTDGGPALLGRLARLLEGEGCLVITTMRLEHWNLYTAPVRAGFSAAAHERAETVGRLLERLPVLTGSDPSQIDSERGGVIDVPGRFTMAEMEAAAASRDPVLVAAAAAATAAAAAHPEVNRQVTQYMVGHPDYWLG